LQGYVRAALRAIGKEIKVIACIAKGSAVDSKLYNGIMAKVDAGMNWNAFHAQGVLKGFIVAGAFATTAFAAAIAKYSTHSAKAAWDTQGTALGLVDNAFAYGYTTNLSAGCQLFFGALAAFANLASWGAAYTLDPGAIAYAVSNIDAFATAHTS
jgi:hypothetical protein